MSQLGASRIPIMIDYSARLSAAYPKTTYSATLRGLREGAAFGDEAIKGIPMFGTPVGRDLRGLVRRAGVLHRIQQMCRAGDLPFQCEMIPMPRGSWHWLELYSANIISHPVRTADHISFPEDTPNRQDQRTRNQGGLFEDANVVPVSSESTLYAWLCYGVTRNGALTHACWNMPSAANEEWLARIDILNAVREEQLSQETPSTEKVDPREAMSFRDSIAATIEGLDKDKDEKK